jgi:putative spermidine/putrescine transport system substrate-binding protein
MGGKDGVQYMTDYVIPALKEKYNITLNLVPGQGKEIVASVMSEKEAGKDVGQSDLVWINGETFYQLRQIDGLYGPYNSLLPNIKYVDMANPIIKYDFQEDIKGYETPWSLANFSLTYDSAKVLSPPVSMQDFEKFWQAHPGTFTLAEDFSGFTLLKTWLIELAGGSKELDGDFDETKYKKLSGELWAFLNKNKKNFWKKGETFPASNTLVQQMFASGELLFGMSFSNADIDIKIRDGVYPKTVRPLILKAGSIQNSSYLGIPYNSGKKATALVIINFLISPEAQAKKSELNSTGSRTVLNISALPEAEQKLFQQQTGVKYSIPREVLAQRAIKEPKPEYMIRIAADFRKYVIQGN